MSADVRTVITGVTGRMGQMLVKLVRDTEGFTLAGGTEKPGHASLGLDVGLACHLGPLEVPVVASLGARTAAAAQPAPAAATLATPAIEGSDPAASRIRGVREAWQRRASQRM